ncbi:hypothetical protein PINS_up016520 [Pythium insidiosum]|nr:hypothetical protein PINS_up016518 [Pythium insidiosum]GLE06858.1 hypothetical protein PINS_up016520 [Pythium insidiosum]
MVSKTLILAAAAAALASQVQADCADQTIKCLGLPGSGLEVPITVGFCWSWFSCKPCQDPCTSCNNAVGRDNIAGYRKLMYYVGGPEWETYGCNDRNP